MKQLMRRVTALFLVLAMAMSFAAVAAATDEDRSIDLSTALTSQDNDAALDAETLYETKAEQSSDSEKEKEEAGDVSREESDEEEDQSKGSEENKEEEPEEEDSEKDASVQVQDSTAGWSKDSSGFSLSYVDNGSSVQAKGGLYSVPAMDLTAEDGTYSFGAGVYEFDAGGKLVAGEYSAAEPTASVTVLSIQSEVLTLKAAAEPRTVTFSGQTTVEGTTVTPGAALASGDVGGVFYAEGKVYTGYFKASETDSLYAVAEGAGTLYSGPMVEKDGLSTCFIGETEVALDNLWYYNGKVYTGFLKSSEFEDSALLYGVKDGVAELFGGCMNKKAFSTYISNCATVGQTQYKAINRFDELWYVEGSPFTGWYENVKTKVVYLLANGKIVTNYKGVKPFIGLMEKMSMTIEETDEETGDKTKVEYTFDKFARNNKVQDSLTGLYYQEGVPLTGVPSKKPTNNIFPVMHMYKNGKVKNMDDGWYKTRSGNGEFYNPYVYYYFKDNEAIHGKENVKLKAIAQGKYKDSSSYYYTFTTTGTLVTNMVKYWGSKYPSKLKTGKFRIFCDHTNYTGTILMYNSKTKNYDIPVKSFVISMSESKANGASNGTKYGNYALASGSSGFYKFKSPKTHKISYFAGSNHIWGSGSMFHGPAYKKTNRRYMVAGGYNNFGTAQTQHCVRVQNINFALIHKLYNQSSGKKRDHGRWCATKVRVYLTRNNSKKNMPFGQMTLLNNFDFNGYILQDTDAYGRGKDMSFDPTDHNVMGDTIYVSSQKDPKKKSQCVKAKMTGYSGYELYYGKA